MRRFFVVLFLLPAVGLAGSVYLNGVNIDGVTGVKFEKATVRIDDQGNILIDAPGYKAQVVQGAPPPPPPQPQPQPQVQAPVVPPQPVAQPPVVMTQPAPKPETPKITRRYWLVATQNAPGFAEYEIDVYINAKYLMTLSPDTDQEVREISRQLTPGQNTVTFEAKKVSRGPRKSFSSEHAFNVVVGEGNEAQGNVMIDRPLVSFKRTAADNDNVSRDFTFATR